MQSVTFVATGERISVSHHHQGGRRLLPHQGALPYSHQARLLTKTFSYHERLYLNQLMVFERDVVAKLWEMGGQVREMGE
jgi:hypothetical protein